MHSERSIHLFIRHKAANKAVTSTPPTTTSVTICSSSASTFSASVISDTASSIISTDEFLTFTAPDTSLTSSPFKHLWASPSLSHIETFQLTVYFLNTQVLAFKAFDVSNISAPSFTPSVHRDKRYVRNFFRFPKKISFVFFSQEFTSCPCLAEEWWKKNKLCVVLSENINTVHVLNCWKTKDLSVLKMSLICENWKIARMACLLI